MPTADGTKSIFVLFQSAPGREAGRCGAWRILAPRQVAFQSAPGREAGRCGQRAVSCVASELFQSAPGREAGRCLTAAGYNYAAKVSIRARP